MSAGVLTPAWSNVIAFPSTTGALSLPAFFGCEPKTVNRSIRLMAQHGPRPLPPWLHRLRRLEELPRITGEALPHIVPYPLVAEPKDIAVQALWIIQSLDHAWSMTPCGFGFAEEAESLRYRLRYHAFPLRRQADKNAGI
jgi:hypothetical protein